MSQFALLSVGIGGVLGALARRYIAGLVGGDHQGTLVVNALGSLALGALTGAGVTGHASLLAATGFCGAFTTFSSFAVETVRLAEEDPGQAAANAVANLLAALAAIGLGAWLAGLVGS